MKSSVKGNQEKGKVCDESRQVLCEEEEVRGRWKQYLNYCIQNRNGKEEEVQAKESRHKQVVVEEVCCSIRRLKNRKAPEDCGITGEMLKAS